MIGQVSCTMCGSKYVEWLTYDSARFNTIPKQKQKRKRRRK
jgi:hypothetical protein